MHWIIQIALAYAIIILSTAGGLVWLIHGAAKHDALDLIKPPRHTTTS